MRKILLTLLFLAAPLVAAERRNILFCFADDGGRYASCYAALDGAATPNSIIKTPNIDRVARDGALFRHAYVNAPSCTPCRSALLSGRYFFNTGRGAILSGAQWDEAIPSFPLLLNEAGYHIGKSLKVWSPGDPADAPFGRQKFAYEKAGRAIGSFSKSATKAINDGRSLDEARRSILDPVGENFDMFLKARAADQPFLYWFGPTTTHRQWVKGSGKKLWGIEPNSLKGKLPPFLPDVPEVREDVADYLGEIQAFDASIGVLLSRLEQAGELEKTVIVISCDHGPPGFPRGKCNLYDFGTQVTLAIRSPGGKPGRIVDDFVNLMDLAPTFLEIGAVALPDKMNGKSLVPLLKSDAQGRIDPERDYVITGRERHVGIAREGNLPYPQRALRTADFLYIRNYAPDRWPLGSPASGEPPSAGLLETETYAAFADMDASPTKAFIIERREDPEGKKYFDLAFAKRPAEELYDVKADPYQINNLAADPAQTKTRQEYATRLTSLLRSAGDPRENGQGHIFEQPPFTNAAARKK